MNKKELELSSILMDLDFKACNIEEICCGIRHDIGFYSKKNNREKLISEIENELEYFNKALNEFRKIN